MTGCACPIDLIVADPQEVFRIGMAEVLATPDLRIIGQFESTEQLLKTLRTARPHVLILSTSLLPAFSQIRKLLHRRKRQRTAVLMLTEENDRIAYVRWLGVQGTICRSTDGPVMLDAIRRVARGELFVHDCNPYLSVGPECPICNCQIDHDCEELRRNIAAHVILHAGNTVGRHKL